MGDHVDGAGRGTPLAEELEEEEAQPFAFKYPLLLKPLQPGVMRQHSLSWSGSALAVRLQLVWVGTSAAGQSERW